jgi:hypothetical protein
MILALAVLAVGGGCLSGGCWGILGAIHRVGVSRPECPQLGVIILVVTVVSAVPTCISWRLVACNGGGLKGALTLLPET